MDNGRNKDMTAEKMQDAASTPVTAHLTPVQRAVFNQAVSAYLSMRAHETKNASDLPSREVKLVFTGDANGQLQFLQGGDARYSDYAEVQMALRHVQESFSAEPSVHFMTATLAEAKGQAETTSVQVLEVDELFSRVIEIEYEYNNTGCLGTCPLSGEMFKPYIGVYPFLAGSWTAVYEEILPPPGPKKTDPSRASWTVGEIQAFMVAQWRAASASASTSTSASASAAQVSPTPTAPALVEGDDGCPF